MKKMSFLLKRKKKRTRAEEAAEDCCCCCDLGAAAGRDFRLKKDFVDFDFEA